MQITITNLTQNSISTDIGTVGPVSTITVDGVPPENLFNTTQQLDTLVSRGFITYSMLDTGIGSVAENPTFGDVVATGTVTASISGTATTLKLASGSETGLVSASTQTLGGSKSFANGLKTNLINSYSASGIAMMGAPTDASNAVGIALGSSTTLANAAAKLVDVKNGVTVKAYFDKDGNLVSNNIALGSTVDGTLSGSLSGIGVATTGAQTISGIKTFSDNRRYDFCHIFASKPPAK